MNGTNCDTASESSSLCGDLIDLALGGDIDGLSDRELCNENEDLSDEEDGINVTIKPGIKPDYSSSNDQSPKVASKIVVPESAVNSMKNLMMGPNLEKSIRNEQNNLTKSANKSKKNGSAKKLNRKFKGMTVNNSNGSGSLITMLAKATATANSCEHKQNTPKRLRSPEPDQIANVKPTKIAKMPNETPPPQTKSRNEAPYQSYREAALQSLDLKICLAHRPPTKYDLARIKEFVMGKVEEAFENNNFIPMFRNSYISKDGFYIFCSNQLCEEWLRATIKSTIPNVNGKLVVIPQSQTVQLDIAPKVVRTVVCLPTKKPNDFILRALAQLNYNIDTQHWRISHRRFKGATNSLLFMRMDNESYSVIKKQNNKINWLIGPVDVEIEHQKVKANNGTHPSRAPAATVFGGAHVGYPVNGGPSSSSEDKAFNPRKAGPNQKVGSASKEHPNH